MVKVIKNSYFVPTVAFIRFEKLLGLYPDLLSVTGRPHNLHINAACSNRYAATGFRVVATLDYGAICGVRIEVTEGIT
jgi:hypothetical protein